MNENQETHAGRTAALVGSGPLVLLRVPRKTYDTGAHRWSHGTPIRFDSWNHAPSHWMRGPCPNCGSPTSTYGGGWTCHDDYCPHSANQFTCSAGQAPDWWETQVNVFRDGDAWCATLDGFVHLQESVAGFGKTPRDAVFDLLQNTLLSESEPMRNRNSWAAKRARAEAKKDMARLDWLDVDATEHATLAFNKWYEGVGTFRAAINAAMEDKK